MDCSENDSVELGVDLLAKKRGRTNVLTPSTDK